MIFLKINCISSELDATRERFQCHGVRKFSSSLMLQLVLKLRLKQLGAWLNGNNRHQYSGEFATERTGSFIQAHSSSDSVPISL